MNTIICLLLLLKTVLGESNEIDLNVCKITHLGTEYIGKLSKTENNATCQYWNLAVQKESETIVDEAFPDGSKILAKNYCRNPSRNPNGPWCYTTQQKLIIDSCDIPFCKLTECRVTGPGMEYSGNIRTSVSGKRCSRWKDKHKFRDKRKEKVFQDRFFPEGSIIDAGEKCRNPDGNITGPWCYVDIVNTDYFEKELCDIPFCDDVDVMMYSEGSFAGQYFFFTSLNESEFLNISFRLWNPDDWLKGEVYLYLGVYDIAGEREELERWSAGVEIMFSRVGSGILSKGEDTPSKIPLILSAAKWTDLRISWTNVNNSSFLVQVYQTPNPKPIAMSEITMHNTIFEFETFKYFSLAGSPALWKVESKDEDCFVHTTSQLNFTRFWLIKKSLLGKNIEIFVRAHREAVILMRTAPMDEKNEVEITIGDKDRIKVVLNPNSVNSSVELKVAALPKILDFWKWAYFKITFFNDRLQIFWVLQSKSELIIETSNAALEKVLWLSFASSWMSYWALYCDPRANAPPPQPSPPECVTQESEAFNGTMSVTKKGRQCVPWTDDFAIAENYQKEELFTPYGGKVFCQNFCRNLDNDPKGAYCFVRDPDSDSGFGLEHCHPRSCSMEDCKISGTGNDYVGRLNVTRSKRECKKWTEVTDSSVEITNFPDPSLEDAGNYCRNPSKTIGGSWCYTTDPQVPKDTCFIKDCDRPLECTILTSRYKEKTAMYILPHWRKYGLNFWLKAWNPDIYEGLIVSLQSLDGSSQYSLRIGDSDNEKVILLYISGDKSVELVHKTLPHLIPTGNWGGYWLRAAAGKVELGYYGISYPFFEWTSPVEEYSFKPMFISFGTILDHWIGINFQCSECLLEQISVPLGNKMYPMNMWKEDLKISSLLLNIRGTGSAYVTLMWKPDFSKHLEIQISSTTSEVFIVEYVEGDNPTILASFSVSSTFSNDKWSQFLISFTENNLIIHHNNVHLLEWPSTLPLLFYWFAVSAAGGTIIWSANCPPADVDGEPRDGNWGRWGPWSCSVTCGGGEGRLERKCNDPPPNVYGEECRGSETYEGTCNDFPCGQISPGTKRSIRQYLSSQYKSLEVDLSDRVVLPCNPQALKTISYEVSEMNITWTHNGFPFSRTKYHMIENFSLVIPRANEKYNGVYLCLALQELNNIPMKVVLEVITLVVAKPRPTRKVRQGSSLNLKCNGLALSYVYADLSQKWELNGTVWKDYGLGSLEAFTMDKVENITDSDGGIWTCIIVQEDFNFRWTTNWLHVKVTQAPNFWSYLMEDVATAPLFGRLGSEKKVMILFFSIVAALLIIVIFCTALLVKLLNH